MARRLSRQEYRERKAVFLAFHRDNPQVFHAYKRAALMFKNTHRLKSFDFRAVRAFVRHSPDYRYLHSEGHGGFKLPGTFDAFYARRLMRRVPELNAFFVLQHRH